MTADTTRDSTAGWMNYYEWTTAQTATLQDYHIAVKFQLPTNFSDWATSNAIQVNYQTEVTNNTKNKVDVTLYNMTDTPHQPVYQSLSNTSTSWSTVTIDKSALNDNVGADLDAADEVGLLMLKVYSLLDATNCTAGADNGCYTRIGDIVLNYLARF